MSGGLPDEIEYNPDNPEHVALLETLQQEVERHLERVQFFEVIALEVARVGSIQVGRRTILAFVEPDPTSPRSRRQEWRLIGNSIGVRLRAQEPEREWASVTAATPREDTRGDWLDPDCQLGSILGRVLDAEAVDARREDRYVAGKTERWLKVRPEEDVRRLNLGVPYGTFAGWVRECEKMGLLAKSPGQGRRKRFALGDKLIADIAEDLADERAFNVLREKIVAVVGDDGLCRFRLRS